MATKSWLTAADRARLGVEPGLCGQCRFGQLKDSGRSAFLLCGLERLDPRYLRYPPLPMFSCSGFQAAAPEEEGHSGG